MVKADKPVIEVVNEPVVRMEQKARLCVYANRVQQMQETSTSSDT